jgi:OST3 / OST6 family, transporter family
MPSACIWAYWKADNQWPKFDIYPFLRKFTVLPLQQFTILPCIQNPNNNPEKPRSRSSQRLTMKSQAPMRQRSDQHAAAAASATSVAASSSPSGSASLDPLFHLLRIVPFSFLRPPRIRLKIPSSMPLPSPMTVFSLVILTYFAVVSGIVYDVIVEPPGIGSVQDPMTRAVKPVVFLPGRVNGQYIIEGLSSGFMFVLGGLGIISMDLAMDRGRAHSVRVSLASFGIAAVVISYAMSMLFIRIKIPGYLW